MAKFDQHRAYLERALEEVTKMHDELSARVDGLKEQMGYLEDTIKALNVYEHVANPSDPDEVD